MQDAEAAGPVINIFCKDLGRFGRNLPHQGTSDVTRRGMVKAFVIQMVDETKAYNPQKGAGWGGKPNWMNLMNLEKT